MKIYDDIETIFAEELIELKSNKDDMFHLKALEK